MMKQLISIILFVIIMVISGIGYWFFITNNYTTPPALSKSYWFVLHRKSNKEYLYTGIPGEVQKSTLVKKFTVKTGIPGERPTPLPQLVGRKYWVITKKEETENPETAPYFLTLNVPGIETEPYGPVPYNECAGQCNWILPGAFGLHGVNDDNSRLSAENPGSSGCIRHSDADISYLYNILDPQKEEIRYYIEDI
jgi:lipoprotein-anchoring transpeptidase ErfK/SrfK